MALVKSTPLVLDLSNEPDTDAPGWLELIVSAPTYALVTISPALAREMIKRNSDNYRKIRDKKVTMYATAMLQGHWKVTGEPIKFDRDGILADGQHRLLACIAANVSFTCDVRTGIAKDAVDVIDTGDKRRSSDVLARSNEANVATLASALRLLVLFLKGSYSFSEKVDNIALREALSYHPHIRHSVVMAQKARVQLGRSSPGALALSHYLMSCVAADRADEFFEHLASGAELKVGSPILALRNRLMTGTKVDMVIIFSIKSWNAWMSGRPLTVLKFMAGESFPIPHH